MVGTFGNTFNFSNASDTVTSSAWIPVGTKFTDVPQNIVANPPGGNGEATVRWDAPNINTPKVQYDSGLNDTGSSPPCFTLGTEIVTAEGKISIEHLRRGNLVLTRENGFQSIRWIGSRKFTAAELRAHPNLRPICIQAGALGDDTPDKHLIVSPQHRILVRSRIAQNMFGTNEILVGAKNLTQIDGIYVVEEHEDVEYFHLLFDRHEIVISNSAKTESFYAGPQALKSLGHAAREEVFAIFPQLKETRQTTKPVPARPFVSGKRGRQLVIRHIKHSRNLVC